jgi:hypothetical protein
MPTNKNANPKKTETPAPAPAAKAEIVEPYVVLRPGAAADSLEIMMENLGSNGVGSLDLQRVKVATGGATEWVIDGEPPTHEIEGVLLAWRMQRIFWKGVYGQAGTRRPLDCISNDGFTGIGNPGGPCNKCPLSEFGSAPSGRGQACKQVRQLLVLRPDNMLPHLLSVPPTSLKAAAQYFINLSSRNLHHWGLVTKLRLERTVNEAGIAYAKIVFTPGRQFTEEQRNMLRPFQKQLRGLLHSDAIDVGHLVEEAEAEEPLAIAAAGDSSDEISF